MKVKIDENLCTACGLCVDNCPEIFEMNDTAFVKNENVPAELEEKVKDAAENCPVEAITIKE